MAEGFVLYCDQFFQMEEIEVCSLHRRFVDALQGSGIGIHLGAVPGQDLGQGGLGHIVGLEIHHGDAVVLHQGAVYDTLQEDLLPLKAITVAIRSLQNGVR